VTEVAGGDVVAHRGPAKRKATVPTARATGDLARLVHQDAKPSPRDRKRTRAARDAPSDDDHVGRAVEADGGPRGRVFEQPVRAHRPMLPRGTVHPLFGAYEPGQLELAQRDCQMGCGNTGGSCELVGSDWLLPYSLEQAPGTLRELRLLGPARLRLEIERLQDVGRREERRRTQAEKRVRAGRERRRDLAGDDEDLSTFLQRRSEERRVGKEGKAGGGRG